MEKLTYCRFCNEKHIVSETFDKQGTVVGMFCNREKALITAFTVEWNGEDISGPVSRFVDFNTDKAILRNIKGDKLRGLAKKLAYQFMQSTYAKDRKINYAFAVYVTLDELFKLREQVYHMPREVFE